MITFGVLKRVFQVQYGGGLGTCFAIDVDGKQYIVSARHILGSIQGEAEILLRQEKQWKSCNVRLVGHGAGDVDISVVAAPLQLAPVTDMEANMDGLTYGQDVYFLGFPYGQGDEAHQLLRGFPLPFVKKAIVSCVDEEPNGPHPLFLNGHGNPGFSGGPVVFRRGNQSSLHVAAVIASFQAAMQPVYFMGMRLPLKYKYNTGIIVAYLIHHAVDLIRKRPSGSSFRVCLGLCVIPALFYPSPLCGHSIQARRPRPSGSQLRKKISDDAQAHHAKHPFL